MGADGVDEVANSLRRAQAGVEQAIVRAETALPALERLATLPSPAGAAFGRSAAGTLEEAEARLARLHERRKLLLDLLEEWEAARADRGPFPGRR
jgi:hypothetical protein